MASNRETRVEKHLSNRVKRLGGFAPKWTSPGTAGVPDRLVLIPGREPLAVEVKTQDGELAPVQRRMHSKLRDAGLTVTTVYGFNGVDDLLDSIAGDEFWPMKMEKVDG